MSWRYRVVRHGDVEPDDSEAPVFAIHEHYDGESPADRGSITRKPVRVVEDSLEDLRHVLGLMLAACDLPVLEEEAFR